MTDTLNTYNDEYVNECVYTGVGECLCWQNE